MANLGNINLTLDQMAQSYLDILKEIATGLKQISQQNDEIKKQLKDKTTQIKIERLESELGLLYQMEPTDAIAEHAAMISNKDEESE